MSDDEKWQKLEHLLKRIVEDALDSRGFKAKTKIGFTSGRWTGVTEEQLAAWREAYGAVDVDSELKKAGAWIVSNPHLAPKSNFARFINTWLSRTQDRSSIRSIPSRSEVEVEKKKYCAYCPTPANGSTNGIWHCSEHSYDAMDGKPRGHMWGVVPKNVTGER